MDYSQYTFKIQIINEPQYVVSRHNSLKTTISIEDFADCLIFIKRNYSKNCAGGYGIILIQDY